MGAKVPTGALLVGAPGTGKTLLAKAIAGETAVPFYSISGSDFVEMFVGVGAARVRDLFKKAKAKSPSIIFIDEIDAVGRKRHGRMGNSDEKDNTLNQLLVEMDGFSTDSKVLVLASTNRDDVLDPALKRPGRFDRIIEFPLPDINERKEIFEVHLKPLKLNKDKTIIEYATRLSSLTPGFTGADISNLCNEAAIFACREDKKDVNEIHFELATERILAGIKRPKVPSKNQLKRISCHESGHVICGWFTKGSDPILKVTIIPRSKGSLGFSQYLPSENNLFTLNELLDKILILYGGRAAEQIIFNDFTTGAIDDIEKATSLAIKIVSQVGMSQKLGHIGYKTEGQEITKPFSEYTNKLIDQESQKILNDAYEKAYSLLVNKKELLILL